MRLPVLVTLIALSACDTGADKPLPDANLNLPMCTGLLYDSCNVAADCMSNNCKLYSNDAIQVCTQACDAAHPCPMQDGQPASCNNRGICKPPAANACHP